MQKMIKIEFIYEFKLDLIIDDLINYSIIH